MRMVAKARSWLDVSKGAGWRSGKLTTQSFVERNQAPLQLQVCCRHDTLAPVASAVLNAVPACQSPLVNVPFFDVHRLTPDLLHVLDLAIVPWTLACTLVQCARCP